MRLAAVLFDFDGTLVDTRSASWPLFERTNREFDLGIDTRERFFALFETNVYEGLVRHCGDPERGAAAAAHFMQLIAEHYDPPFVPGIGAIARRLAQRATLAIVSSNTRPTIARILARDGLGDCFGTILAGDVEPSKTRAIRRFLNGDGNRRFAPDDVVLVTDTTGDVREAHGAGIAALGVAWGMHSREQLLAAGAASVANTPDDLMRSLFEGRDDEGENIACRAAP